MKIAHVLGSLGMGGAERVALDLATEQKKLGHQVVAISLSDQAEGPLSPVFRDAGIAVHQVAKKPGLDWTLPARVARCLRELGIEVVHTHNTQPLVYAAAASRLSGHAVIHTKHGEGHLVSRAGQFLRRLGSPFVHSFVAVSEKTAEHARRQWAYPLPSRIRVITNGIRLDAHRPDAKDRAQVREELGIPSDAWVVGTVGRCDENKNQIALIEVLEAMPGDVHLIVVGEGESSAKLTLRAEASGARARIHLLGRRLDAARIMRALDAFALPSLSEGLPLVILEAMATALPVVSSDVGGIAKVIDQGRSGYLVPARDSLAMTQSLLALRGSVDLAQTIGRAARAQVQARYSAERMARDYIELYRLALGPKR